ncbi:MAG: flagellar basal body P-ring formation chaperone FlgA, partial [Planctomycetota bacterium]|nr:flagellar basal body P-ring formation chaperone FlgA [Planctomycetota bacterium]
SVVATVELKPSGQTSDGFIRFDDVAVLHNTANADIAEVLSGIMLGRAPELGGSVTISLEQLKTEMRKAGVDLVAVVFKGATETVITRIGAPVSGRFAFILAARIEEFLVKKFKLYDTELLVDVKRIESCEDISADSDVVVVEVSTESANPIGISAFRAKIEDSAKRIREVNTTVTVRAFRNVLVAKSAMQSGHQVRECDVEFQRCEISNLADRTGLASVVGARLTSVVRKGEQMLSSGLKQPPCVRSRDMVLVDAGSEGLELYFNGIAMEDGAVGDIIRVQNNVTGQSIAARVVQSGRVCVVDGQAASKRVAPGASDRGVASFDALRPGEGQ